MVAFADLGRSCIKQWNLFIAYLIYVTPLKLFSLSPYKGALPPSTPTPAREAPILTDIVDSTSCYKIDGYHKKSVVPRI